MQDLELYLNMELPERSRSENPSGYKHFSKDELSELTIFSGSLLFYKLKNLFIGGGL